MPLQAFQVGPGETAIIGAEQTSRLYAGIEAAIVSGQAPHGLDRGLAFLVSEPFGRMAPALAEIVGFPDRRAEPAIPAGGIDRSSLGMTHDMIDWPCLAERPTQ